MTTISDWLATLVVTADRTVIWYFLVVNSFYALLLFLAVPEIWKHWKITRDEDLSLYLGSEALPPISVMIPAYNMQASITDSVDAQLALDYPSY